jgi:hypothetical protein
VDTNTRKIATTNITVIGKESNAVCEKYILNIQSLNKGLELKEATLCIVKLCSMVEPGLSDLRDQDVQKTPRDGMLQQNHIYMKVHISQAQRSRI